MYECLMSLSSQARRARNVTPAAVVRLKPPDCSLTTDVHQCRWKGTLPTGQIITVGFGPRGMDKKTVLEVLLGNLWSGSHHRREAHHWVEFHPAGVFDGVLDGVHDQPTKYPRTKK